MCIAEWTIQMGCIIYLFDYCNGQWYDGMVYDNGDSDDTRGFLQKT